MNLEKKPLIILTGPTAAGKTALSIALAKACNGEIISADSMQVYRHMDIGTAKIRKDEMEHIPHYLIDEYEPDEAFNVVEFQKRAKACIEDIISRNKIPIIVGGTGFYIQAVLYDIQFDEAQEDVSYRQELEMIAQTQGALKLHEMLAEVDAEAAKQIHYNNIKKVIRALEYHHQTGGRISEHNEVQRQNSSPYNFAYFVLTMDRQKLYERIEKRIDIMLNDGLLDEVKGLLDKGYTRDMVSMQGLGYKEIIDYLHGVTSFEDAIEILKRDTRHFAKRQLTWFRREKEVIWVNKDEFENEQRILEYMLQILQEKKIIESRLR